MNITAAALAKIKFLEERGFQIDKILMEKVDKQCYVDSWGRVVWNHEVTSE